MEDFLVLCLLSYFISMRTVSYFITNDIKSLLQRIKLSYKEKSKVGMARVGEWEGTKKREKVKII